MPTLSEAEILAFLKTRQADQGTPPVDPLTAVHRYLQGSPLKHDGTAHWYCALSPSAVHKEVATYLIYFFAFNRTNIAGEWMDQLEKLVAQCEGCARGFCKARSVFTGRYISRFPAATKLGFQRAVDQWQARQITAALDAAPSAESELAPRILDLKAPYIQLLFACGVGSGVISNPDIRARLIPAILAADLVNVRRNKALTGLGLCPGYLKLLTDDIAEISDSESRRKVQDWVNEVIKGCVSRPIRWEEWQELGLDGIWLSLLGLQGIAQKQPGKIQSTDASSEPEGDRERDESLKRWRTVLMVLESGCLATETVEKAILQPGKNNLIVVIAGSFGSQDPVFALMLRVFAAALRACPRSVIWSSADPSMEFPLTIAANIQQNPLYLDLLQTTWDRDYQGDAEAKKIIEDTAIAVPIKSGGALIQPTSPSLSRPDWVVGWMIDFLISVRDLDVRGLSMASTNDKGAFGESLARLVNFCFEGLQHRRFAVPFRARVMEAGIKVLSNTYCDLGPSRSKVDRTLQAAMLNALEIHAGTITGVALDHKEYPDGPAWDTARHVAIDFLYKVFMSDGDNVRRVLTLMGQQALDARARKSADQSDFFPKMIFAEQLWRKTYATANSRDIYGIIILMRGMMRFAHLPTPRGNAWGYTGLSFWEPEGKWAASITSVTASMKIMKNGFGDKLTGFVAVSEPAALKALFDTPKTPEAIMRLLLCSDDDVHDAIIGLVQGIFDQVDERVDCFRAMLLHFPVQSMVALQDYLERWVQDAQSLPTAVESARWLVRCFTDILEVLCRQSGAGSGLAFLRDPNFIEMKTARGKMSDDISALWNAMTKALSVIIKRTPKWAPYYDNGEMVDWMQDALIFGRLLVEENRTFEGAAQGTAISTRESPAIEAPSQLTEVGDRMISQMEQVLDSLISWLRLTEIETLHQTYELLKSLLDRLAKGRSSASVSEALKKSFTSVDGFCRRSKGYRTKLNDSELAELAVLIKPFLQSDGGSDDEIEYISSSMATSTAKDKSRETPSTQKKADAFAKLMQNAEKGTVPRRREVISVSGKTTPASSPVVINVDDFDDEFDEYGDDDFLAGMDVETLDNMETSAANREAQRKLQKSQGSKLPDMFKKSGASTSKPITKPIPKPIPKPAAPVIRGSGLLSKIRREVAADSREKPALVRQLNRDVLDRGPSRLISKTRAKTPSETSSSSESDEEGGGLAALKQLQKQTAAKSKLTAPTPRPRLAAITRPEMSPAERQRLNAQRTKARLKPDMTALWATILKWDPNERNFPDNLPNQIPAKFRDVEQYTRTYMALFFRELRDQSLNEMNESSDPINLTVEIASRQHTDNFIDMEMSLVGKAPFGFYLNEYETCLISAGERPVLVKVQSYKRNPRNVTLHVRMDNSRDSPFLAIKSRCQLRKHMNMSTAAREYAALKGLPYYEPDLLQSILDAKPTTLPEVQEVTWRKAMTAYNVNEPQAKAIIGSMRVKGFALIQGPPGTGKTKTISGLAGRFMTERPTHTNLHGSGKTVNAKLLICAPSNAAIDEVTRRLKDGVPTSDGKMLVPQIVRLGAEASMNAAVKDVSLDSLIEARVSSVKAKGGDTDLGIKRVELALEEIRQKREAKQGELAMAGDDAERRHAIEAELTFLVQQRILKSKEMNKFRDDARDSGRQLDGARREAREKILQDADIICSTLAGAGHDSIAAFQFDTVIIDEAAQSVEPSALVPLKYGCTRCILVGDPQQLPPTVISTKAESVGYNQSLFVRMVEGHPEAMHLLSIQYRMHPDISRLPSQVFYGGRLHDGPGMATKTRAPWHQASVFGTYRFYNVNGPEVRAGRQSLKNPTEVDAIVSLYRGLKGLYGSHDALLGRIGIISPYREQFNELKRSFRQNFGETAFDDIDFGTIDGFQGQEKDIIILSTVRSTDHGGIGFLRDVRRMNVALTRAKSSLFIIGNAATLERADDKWNTIVGNARERGFLVKYEHGMFINPAKTVTAPDGQAKLVGPRVLDPLKRIGEKPLPSLPRPLQVAPPAPVVSKSIREDNKVVPTSKADIMDLDQAEKRKEKKRKRQLAASDSSETGSSVSTSKLPDKPPKKKPALSEEGKVETHKGTSMTAPDARAEAAPPRPKPKSQIPKPPLHVPTPAPPPPVKRAPAAGDGLFVKKAKNKYRQQ